MKTCRRGKPLAAVLAAVSSRIDGRWNLRVVPGNHVGDAVVATPVATGLKIDRWYDKSTRNWIVTMRDSGGHQVGDAIVVYRRDEAAAIKPGHPSFNLPKPDPVILMGSALRKFVMALEPGSKLLEDKNYVYHGTAVENLDGIRRRGLQPTDTLWTKKPAIYATVAWSRAGAWGPLVLRVPASLPWRPVGDGMLYLYKAIPAIDVQALTDNGWMRVNNVP